MQACKVPTGVTPPTVVFVYQKSPTYFGPNAKGLRGTFGRVDGERGSRGRGRAEGTEVLSEGKLTRYAGVQGTPTGPRPTVRGPGRRVVERPCGALAQRDLRWRFVPNARCSVHTAAETEINQGLRVCGVNPVLRKPVRFGRHGTIANLT